MSERFAAFQHAPYRRYFLSRFLSAFGAQVLSMAVAWQMYDETGSKILLGLVELVQFLPGLVLVLYTGVASDRFGRRMMMGLSVATETLCAVAILAMTFTGNFNPYVMLGVLVLFGTSRAFFRPAVASLVVNLVPEKDFPNAVGWNSSSWQAASILGPVAGGLLYGISPNVAYGTAAVMFALAVLIIIAIPKPDQRKSTDPVSLEVLMGGFSYVFRQKVVLGAISLDLFAVLFGGIVALMPIYARDILDIGEVGLGLLRAAPGIGAIVMMFFLASFPIKEHAGLTMFIGVVFFGVATIVFGLSVLPWLSILALAAYGAADMISMYVRAALIQLWTPDELRGRVSAINSVFISASNELGGTRAAFMAALIGTVSAATLGGFMIIAIAGMWALAFPQLRRIQRLEAPDHVKDADAKANATSNETT